MILESQKAQIRTQFKDINETVTCMIFLFQMALKLQKFVLSLRHYGEMKVQSMLTSRLCSSLTVPPFTLDEKPY